ncbi:glycosyltransferase family 4 protein [Nocardioides bruguierae]|nr:glycosyltransferase family 4 protein [Nocardioides bruguierae]
MKIQMQGSEWFDSRPGGLNRYFTNLSGALADLGVANIKAVAFGQVKDSYQETWGAPGRTPRNIIRSRSRRAGDVRPDILDRHFALYGYWPTGSRRVFHFHGPWAEESVVSGASPLRVLAKRSVEKAAYRNIDAAVVLSASFKELLHDDYQVPLNKIHIIQPGVSMVSPNLSSTDRQSDRPLVVCVRRLEKRMGIDVLLESWRQVVRSLPDARLAIVGVGSQDADLRALAQKLPIGSVQFMGRLSDEMLDEIYAKSWMTVVPSVALEGFGLISIESQARGRPVVVTNVGGLAGTVAGLDTSLVVPPASSEALAERIIGALEGNRPSSEQCIASAGRFNWENVARQHLSLYQELAN